MKSPTRQLVHLIAVLFMLMVLLAATILDAVAQTESTSDLAISIYSAPPKHAKACDTFDATYTITNFGPDDASNVSVLINIPDQFETINLTGVPVNLAVGQSATVTVTVKVVAFGFGESRTAWVRATTGSDIYPDISIDPNSANNEVYTPVKLISKPAAGCP